MPFRIVTCHEWGARKPKSGLEVVPRAQRIIFHHTAGHHPEISGPGDESYAECVKYAQAIQDYHMSEGWIDSGHNFLVCRNGVVLQGRWLSVSAIQAGHMVRSAHCPGQNNQVGIEHEHAGTEPMTIAQRRASAELQAWIARHYGKVTPLPVDPHSAHFATACPANLKDEIQRIRDMAQQLLAV